MKVSNTANFEIEIFAFKLKCKQVLAFKKRFK